MTWSETLERLKGFIGRQFSNNVDWKWGILRVIISFVACFIWTIGFLIFLIVISKYRFGQEIGWFPITLSILMTTGVFYTILFWRRK